MDGRGEWRELLLLERKGGAVRFGAGRWATVPHDDRLDVGAAMTVACWVRMDGDGPMGDHQVAIEKGAPWAPGSYSLQPVFDDEVVFEIPGHDDVGGGGHLLNTGWRHIAATYDGLTAVLYVDGMPVGEVDAPNAIRANDGSIYIGSRAGQNHWLQGELDELYLFDEALDHAQVWELSAVGFIGDVAASDGLLATQWQRLKAGR